ncbi:hypothetical protein DFH09DRAFT_1098658 [Mycena vulgaris]|nr:hypothetical protein DFH09DRAFT_1098658 [Mycena vulgaris]
MAVYQVSITESRQPRTPARHTSIPPLHHLPFSPVTFIRLSFDAEVIPTAKKGSSIRVVQGSLYSLDVCYSAISNSLPMARFLSGIFPNLGLITTDREYRNNCDAEELELDGAEIAFHRLWKEVESQIPEFVRARVEERGLRLV